MTMIAVILVSAAYIAAQMLADITSLKIVSIDLGMLGSFSMDAGTIIYPITFTLRDLVHKVAGKRAARTIILAAAVVNLLMAGLFWLVGQLPYDPDAGLQPDWDAVLSPVWRIVIASIVAEVVAELIDTEVYHLWVTRVTRRYQWARVLLSNVISVPLDSLIFCWGAFGDLSVLGIPWLQGLTGFPSATVWSIFLANVLLKGVVTLVSLPAIYIVRKERTVEAG